MTAEKEKNNLKLVEHSAKVDKLFSLRELVAFVESFGLIQNPIRSNRASKVGRLDAFMRDSVLSDAKLAQDESEAFHKLVELILSIDFDFLQRGGELNESTIVQEVLKRIPEPKEIDPSDIAQDVLDVIPDDIKTFSLESVIKDILERLPEPVPGKDGENGEITDAEIQHAAEIAVDMIELPDLSIAITQEPESVRNSLELLQGEERLKMDSIRGLQSSLETIELKINSVNRRYRGGGGKNSLRFLNDVSIDGITDGQGIAYQSSSGKFVPVDLNGGGGGEANTASNVGAGAGTFKQKTGVDLEFRSLVAGANTTIVQNTDDISISSTGEANTATALPSPVDIFKQKVGVDLEFRGLFPGVGFSLTEAPDNILIEYNPQTQNSVQTISKVISLVGDVASPGANRYYGTDGTGTRGWYVLSSGGESNTASNVGAGGVGLFKQKVGVDLEFKNINAGSNKITVTDDVANDEVDIDVDESNLNLGNMGGTINIGTQTDLIAGTNITLTGSTLDVDDVFLLNTGDTGTGAYDFGGATTFEIPNSASPTLNTDGQIAVDTSVTDFSYGILKYYGGEELGVVSMPIAQFVSPNDGYVVSYSMSNGFELVAPSGGGGAPGGPDHAIQFNDNGVFGGEADFTYNDATNVVTVGTAATITSPGASGSTTEVFGLNASATGIQSTVLGNNADSTGPFNVVIGYNAQQTGGSPSRDIVLIGRDSVCSQPNSVVIGSQSSGTGTNEIVIGFNASATQNEGICIGVNGSVTGTSSIGIGPGVSIAASNAVGIGDTVTAGANGVSIGTNAQSGSSTVAIGQNSNAAFTSALAVGASTTGGVRGSAVGNFATATNEGDTSFGFSADATGIESTSVGSNSSATGLRAMSLGSQTNCSGQYSIGIGYNADIIHNESIGLGRNAQSTANNQLVIGSQDAEIINMYLGEGVTAVSPGTVTINATGGSGTNNAANDISIAGGRGTGTGTGGSVKIQTAPAGTSGSTLNPLQDVAEFTEQRETILSGSFSAPISTVTANYTIDDEDHVIIVDATSANITITLPATSGITGRQYYIKRIDTSANTVTIDGNGSETIDGSTTQTLTLQYESLQIVSDGSNWFII